MIIFHCYRDYSEYGLSAVVICANKERAIEMLGWEIDEDTTKIIVSTLGDAYSSVERIVCEESL